MVGSVKDSRPGETWRRDEWLGRRASHERLVGPRVKAHLDRRARGLKHPVEDFLFDYYPFPPAKLRTWFPPLGVAIEADAEDFEVFWPPDRRPFFRCQDGVAWLNPQLVPEKILRQAAWVESLCRAVAERSPRFSCHGLHEWAMVYRQTPGEVRHRQHSLRLPADELAAFVESRLVCCTHYDAFRFFTPAARPLNALQPTLETRLQNEQGGCLHANMDLYKWAFKLWPWCGTELVGRAFDLAMSGREIDMRASPYDLRELGFEPIRIETIEGRAEYERHQRQFAGEASALRAEIRAAADRLLAARGASGYELPELVLKERC